MLKLLQESTGQLNNVTHSSWSYSVQCKLIIVFHLYFLELGEEWHPANVNTRKEHDFLDAAGNWFSVSSSYWIGKLSNNYDNYCGLGGGNHIVL